MTTPMMALNQSPVMMFCPLTDVLKQMGLVLFWQALRSGSVPRVTWEITVGTADDVKQVALPPPRMSLKCSPPPAMPGDGAVQRHGIALHLVARCGWGREQAAIHGDLSQCAVRGHDARWAGNALAVKAWCWDTTPSQTGRFRFLFRCGAALPQVRGKTLTTRRR